MSGARGLMLSSSLLLFSCASLHSPVAIPNTQTLAGAWHGRVSGFAGHAMAVMTIADTGAYSGTMLLDAGDKPFQGASVVGESGRGRCQGTMGSGSVRLAPRGGAG